MKKFECTTEWTKTKTDIFKGFFFLVAFQNFRKNKSLLKYYLQQEKSLLRRWSREGGRGDEKW